MANETLPLLFDAAGMPIMAGVAVPRGTPVVSRSAGDLIRMAREQRPQPIIQGLLNVGDVLLLHGSEESFKSVLVLQMAESIALGVPLIRFWNVPQGRHVGIINTEIHESAMGERLMAMFPDGRIPEDIGFFPADAMRTWRRKDLDGKFEMIQEWIDANHIQVLLIDTANDFFRGRDDPSREGDAGRFFDRLRNLSVQGRVIVRHDRKHREEDAELNSNERIRGSGEWKEDPETILFVSRHDRRTNQLFFEVGKLRYGRKPNPFTLWFDVDSFRLLPLPPVIAVLESGRQTRQQVLEACQRRFDLSERKVDDMLAEQREFLLQHQNGHQREFEIDRDRAVQAPWWPFIRL